ncbi:MAG: PqqD family peptide modification chaperone [Muribaculaceae bacterium]|nr:PqqD family peptide modification chaperone [Muribaculaceae bacterium]
MKISSKYKFREIAGEVIAVNQGTSNIDITQIISLNSSAYVLYKEFADKKFTTQDVIDSLIRIYNITPVEATLGAQTWVDSMIKCHIIEE